MGGMSGMGGGGVGARVKDDKAEAAKCSSPLSCLCPVQTSANWLPRARGPSG